jgi:hypothetical protein
MDQQRCFNLPKGARPKGLPGARGAALGASPPGVLPDSQGGIFEAQCCFPKYNNGARKITNAVLNINIIYNI